ncbi:MAG TPA: GNAT family N-acetyltransferase [Pyrinomonadaceae bacterium]|jgi:predicted GNAT superfamily acetyltransferase
MNQAETEHNIKIREVSGVKEFNRCIELQRAAFNLPDLEISPLRHFIVTNNCGGFTLGAFAGERLVGFVHHLIAVKNGEIIGYSHMAAISPDFQNAGIGARLKWAQREKALSEGVKFIKWTFEPMQSRNAHFNLNRLGATVSTFAENYYGTDFNPASETIGEPIGLDSDRLFAYWRLDSERVRNFERGASAEIKSEIAKTIEIPANWSALVKNEPNKAREEQLRVRAEFQTAFAENLICARFERGAETSRYLLYREI